MTDDTQELDEILELLNRATVSCERLWVTVADHELSVYEAKQAILDWHNKQVEEVLDRLESMAAYDPSGSSPVINPRQIEAERNKLKEGK